MHEMVSDRSSRADFWANLRQISLRVFFTSTKMGGNDNMVQKNTTMLFFVKKSSRNYMPHPKVGKNKCSDMIYLNLISVIIYNLTELKSIRNHMNLRNVY